jgi:hypothetical protein
MPIGDAMVGYWNTINNPAGVYTFTINNQIGSQAYSAPIITNTAGVPASLDLADGFVFQVGESILVLDAAPQGGSRFPVQARMAGRPFVGFHLDIGVGDDLIEPTDRIEGEGWFDFVGLPRPQFRMISREQQFAEKLHAYTLPLHRRSR